MAIQSKISLSYWRLKLHNIARSLLVVITADVLKMSDTTHVFPLALFRHMLELVVLETFFKKKVRIYKNTPS